MSQQNVEFLRIVIDAWNEGGPEAAKRYSAEDSEYHDPPTLPDAKVIRGRDAIAKHFAENEAAIGRLHFVIRHALPAGDDSVVLLMDLGVRGVQSGIEMAGTFAQVVEMEDRRVRRTRSFLTWQEALETAGLSKQAANFPE